MPDKGQNSIAIVDYGMGNVRSVQRALERLGCNAVITNDHDVLQSSDGLILPGVGAFGKAMDNLRTLGLVEVLTSYVLKEEKPIIGICLGMQLFAESSDELGTNAGLGWIPGKVKLIDTGAKHLSLPHVGWNNVSFDSSNQIFDRIDVNTHFYFDHSFYFETSPEYVTCTTEYGCSVVAGIQKEQIFGMQFHPEKSQTAGLKILRNYLNYVGGYSSC